MKFHFYLFYFLRQVLLTFPKRGWYFLFFSVEYIYHISYIAIDHVAISLIQQKCSFSFDYITKGKKYFTIKHDILELSLLSKMTFYYIK